jgi:hypothetical protein
MHKQESILEIHKGPSWGFYLVVYDYCISNKNGKQDKVERLLQIENIPDCCPLW